MVPACIPARELTEASIRSVQYGQMAFSSEDANKLQQVKVDSVPLAECNKFYKNKTSQLPEGLVRSFACVIDVANTMDSCLGSYGAPLEARLTIDNLSIPYIFGVASFGSDCMTKSPSVYTKLDSYFDWIQSVVFGQ